MIVKWEPFARDVVGGQLARAADSVGANVAEAYGRFHYGEKLQFLYYARGSLFETKYWLNRALTRGLMSADQVQHYALQLTEVARQLNAFAGSIKKQRRGRPAQAKVREATGGYVADARLFSEVELEWLQAV
ncbi:MAG: four helix bundle protein [Anaerolineae bacterium]|nr:four helix bundle protein [Anaerolineae bacterium]